MAKNMRDIMVSRFETFTDDFRFDDNKSICNTRVNIKEKTISFTLESGDAPSLYVVLLTMSVNRHWLNVVDSFEGPPDLNRYFLLTRWISFEAADYYFYHDGEDGMPVIDKCLIKCSDGSGVSSCTLSPFQYLLLIEYDSRFSFSTPKSCLKELRESYEFRYQK